jgi:uncharacterized protein YoaH (UPF0181 family)
MGLRDELTEPWGMLLAATAGGLAWAIQLPTPAAIGIAAAAYATKVGIAVVTGRPARRPARNGTQRIDRKTEEGRWLTRAEDAVASFPELSAGPVADRLGSLGPQAQDTVDTLHQLAYRGITLGNALRRIDAGKLRAEHERLTEARFMATPDITADLDRSLASVDAQLDVHQRLRSARSKVIAQLESGTLGLESLVARAVELSASSSDHLTDDATHTIDNLTDELEGIRRGITETEETTRRALGT